MGEAERSTSGAPMRRSRIIDGSRAHGRRTGRYRVLVEPEAWRHGLISRADVADFLIREAEEGRCLGKYPVLAY